MDNAEMARTIKLLEEHLERSETANEELRRTKARQSKELETMRKSARDQEKEKGKNETGPKINESNFLNPSPGLAANKKASFEERKSTETNNIILQLGEKDQQIRDLEAQLERKDRELKEYAVKFEREKEMMRKDKEQIQTALERERLKTLTKENHGSGFTNSASTPSQFRNTLAAFEKKEMGGSHQIRIEPPKETIIPMLQERFEDPKISERKVLEIQPSPRSNLSSRRRMPKLGFQDVAQIGILFSQSRFVH